MPHTGESTKGRTPFDSLETPLEGTNLIEASAGTGKTYTLTSLFVRLVVEKGLSVDRILVVTFTEAATAELKERIRGRVRGALDAFAGVSSPDPFLEGLARKIGRTEAAHLRLRRALRDFDRAAVFTIHGFCRRTLEEHAFESGTPFEADLLPDQTLLEQGVVEDFWRREMGAASPLFAAFALARGFTPVNLLSLARSARSVLPPDIVPREGRVETEPAETAYLTAFERVAEAWSGMRAEVSTLLLECDALNRVKYRKDSVTRWIRAMDHHASPGRCDPLLFEGFERFASSRIEEAARKNHEPPGHPFFDLCEDLLQARDRLNEVFDRRLLSRKAALFDEMEAELPKWKAERNVRSFDDLLRGVYDALRARDGDRLGSALRARYGAALIDEFQDTDPVQYGIFKRVFSDGRTPLFLIGDPKQAIYGFRGADVFAYMAAAGETPRRYTLPRNYRSEPGLVRAVNTLFGGHQNPFVFDAIPFYEVEPAGEEKEIPALSVGGRSAPPFRIWIADAGDLPSSKGKIAKETGRRVIPEAVALEIERLIAAGRSGEARIGGDSVREGDIAVLLRTNNEARIVHRALASRRIPSVLYTTSSLFETGEAVEMERILRAMARPEREDLLRAALATAALGWDALSLEGLISDAGQREGRLLRFRTCHEAWREKGFIHAFLGLLRGEGALPRLLGLPDGERRATNLLHLSEVLHQAEAHLDLGPEGLLKWLSEQLDPRTRGREEHPLRLESDRNAVSLVTVHKSKGLQYPIVFCPFIWEPSGIRARDGAVAFHERTDGFPLTLDLGSPEEERKRHVALAEEEALSENLRLLYVAFTRARNRCTTVWGPFNRAGSSAAAYLFHARLHRAGRTPAENETPRFERLGESDLRADLETLRETSGGTVQVDPLPAGSRPHHRTVAERIPELSARDFGGRIDRTWGVASFTSLTASHPHGDEVGEDEPETTDRPARETGGLPPGEAPAGLHGFPAGTRSGTCLHLLLETLDFTRLDARILSDAVREALRDHGFEAGWEEAVCRMVRSVVSTPLDPDREALRLDRVPLEDRLNELSFFMPLRPLAPKTLRDLLRSHAGSGIPAVLPKQVGRLRFSRVQGAIRGFVDLVFRFEGRYFLVDWKSNDLGPSMEDYRRERVEAAMTEGLYHLQYLLYTLALDRYLAARVPGYDYGSHFGGVFYVFLRGVDPDFGPGYGLFRGRPPEPLIRSLRRGLLPPVE
jgi:exodeoxyribonuclease V beta subunit